MSIMYYVMKSLKTIYLISLLTRQTPSVKVAISEFGLLMLMLILFNHYMFNEVMRYLHDNR